MKKLITIVLMFSLVLSLFIGVTGFASCTESKITIGVSLPTQDVERWVRNKENLISEAAKQGVNIKVQVANDDPGKQISQCENLISQGVDVLIIAAADAVSSATSVEAAKQAGIPVLCYVRLVENCDLDAHIAYDNEKVGELQGKYLTQLVPKGNYIVLAGSKTDHNSFLFKEGAMKYIQPLVDKGDVKIVMEQFVKGWQPAEALKIVENALTANNNKIDGILSPNDSLAGAAIQALAAQGLAGKVPVTGGDAELAAARRIIEGTQTMTAYRDLLIMDQKAIEVAIKLAKGEDISDDATETINNNYKDVPAILLAPIVVDKNNIDEVLIKSGYHSKEDVYGK
jgi:D-xylose transport system substrate-binding protein